jgi:sterol desaturase/sphingolipid hydroxylase (fatty acid hydroxylase superfamily)
MTRGRARSLASGGVLALVLAVGLLLSLGLFWQLWRERADLAAPRDAETGILPTPSMVTADDAGRLVWRRTQAPVQLLRSLAAFALALLAVALVFVPLEALAGGPPAQRGVRTGTFTDAFYWFFTPMVTKPISKATIVVIPALAAWTVGVPLTGPVEDLRGFWSRQPVWLVFAAMILVSDLCAYWMHRLMHTRWLWPFHAIHHSSEQPDWLASVRVHPVDDMLLRWAQVVPLLLLGFPGPAIGLLASVLSLASLVLHSNLGWTLGPLRYVVATPTFHRWHHTRDAATYDKNFSGVLPLCDLLFGTFHLPRGVAPNRFGLAGSPVPADVLGQLAYPLMRRRGAPRAVEEYPRAAAGP